MSLEINILTLNVWGIPFPIVVKDREERISAIGLELSSGRYDIVSLQEVWSSDDGEKLRQVAKTALPYSHYFYSGVIGAGLLVLSKYPIIGTLFHAWSVNGYFHRIQHADWFGGKGVGMCRILIKNQVVHLYNAHLHAEYDNGNDEYKTHRVIQAFDTAQFIRATRDDSVLQVLAGDLNAQPQDLAYKVLLYISKMSDCCSSEQLTTNECQHNSYTSKRALSKNLLGIRIDHILIRVRDDTEAVLLDFSLPFPIRVPGRQFSYSDHEAVAATLRLNMVGTIPNKPSLRPHANCEILEISTKISNEGDSNLNEGVVLQRINVLHESIALCETSLTQLKLDRKIYLGVSICLAVLIALVEDAGPDGFRTLYLLLKLVCFGIILFSAFMGSVWNYIERNGVMSGKVSMQAMLRCIEIFELETKRS